MVTYRNTFTLTLGTSHYKINVSTVGGASIGVITYSWRTIYSYLLIIREVTSGHTHGTHSSVSTFFKASCF